MLETISTIIQYAIYTTPLMAAALGYGCWRYMKKRDTEEDES